MEWERDLNSLPLALEIIDTSFNLNNVFFSTRAINYILNNFSEQLGVEMLNKIFLILQRRFLHSLPPGLDEKCRNSIAKNLACLSSLNPNYMDDKNWGDYVNLDDIILYYTFLAEYYNNEYCDYSTSTFKSRLEDERRILFICQLLTQAEQLTPAWIDLLRFISQIVDGENYDSSIINEFLPALQTIPNLFEQNNIYSKFFDLYTVLFIEYYSVGYAMIDNSHLAEEIMMVLVNMVEKLFDENVEELQALQFTSVAWNEIIDYDYEFFRNCSNEFLGILLQKFVISMRFLINDPTEFVNLAEISKYKFNPIVKEKNDFLPIIFQFLDIIILAINSNYDEFINIDENRDSLSRTISALTNFFDDDDSQDDFSELIYNQGEFNAEEFKKVFDEYFGEKIKEFNDGIIFTIASSTSCIKKTFAPIIAEQILASDPIPQSALHFVRLSNVDVGDQNLDGVISLSYSSFIDEPNITALQAISQLILQKPQVFDENAKKLIEPLVSWLQESPPPLTPYLMQCLIYYLSYQIMSQQQAVEGNLDSISEAICGQVSSLLQSDTPGMFDFLKEIVDISHTIIDKVQKKIESDESTDPNEIQDNIIIIFFHNLFNHFIEILDPLWRFQSDQVMISLCDFLLDAHKATIITDYSQIIQWIGEALFIAPVTSHIELLKLSPIYELLPTEPIMKFIVSFPEIEDSELQCRVYSFISYLFNNEWPDFFNFFEIDLLLSPLSSSDNRIVGYSIELIKKLIKSNFCNEFIDSILDVIVDGMLSNFQLDSIRNSVQILIDIIVSEKSTVDQIGEIVSNHLKSDTTEFREFQESLTHVSTGDRNEETFVFKAAKKLISLYHTPVESEDLQGPIEDQGQ